jgi:CRP-like cAMP-binding protein
MTNQRFLDKLMRIRFHRKEEIRKVIDAETKLRQRRPLFRSDYVQGVHKGVFFRIKVPPKRPILPDIPKMPVQSSLVAPKAFKAVEPTSRVANGQETTKEAFEEFWRRLSEWWHLNWPTLLLNCGSIASLVGFTRSDVLELRILSVTGSLTAVIYHAKQIPLRPVPILWGLTFAAVNSYFIRNIYKERTSSVRLTREQEEIYDTYFLRHGVTPKQFELIYSKAEILHIPKNKLIIRQGEKLDCVYLVVKGKTLASALGRRLSAVSIKDTHAMDDADEHREASGAWIGEMAFLEQYWIKQQAKRKATKSVNNSEEESVYQVAVQPKRSKSATDSGSSSATEGPADDARTLAHRRTIHAVHAPPPVPRVSHSFYTIVATDDCTVMRWSHEEMEELIEASADMRGAMTRAMTAAIIDKVINFTVSRSRTRIPQWSSWLDDMKYGSYTAVNSTTSPKDAADGKQTEETLPTYELQ